MKNRLLTTPLLRGRSSKQSPTRRVDCFLVATLLLLMTLLSSCTPVDLNPPIPVYDTGVDPNTWVKIPAGEFYFGQHNKSKPPMPTKS